jgi:hypothetical protein
MSEDELLSGLIEALGLAGYWVHHDRRSDLAVQMGASGFPDIVAIHPDPSKPNVAIECKSETGRLTADQEVWIEAFRTDGWIATVIRPSGYDAAIAWIFGDRLIRTGGWSDVV